jgi:SAM-dependent methyltransferase
MRKEFYDEYFQIEDRHWWFVGRRRIFLKILDSILASGRRESTRTRILDVGCGTGTMLGYLSTYGEAVGIDTDATAVAYCRERGLTAVTHAPTIPWPFPDQSFDLVTMLDVLEHADDDLELLREIGRVLTSGGQLLVAVPAYQFLWGRQDVIAMHKRRYTAGRLRQRLREAGYEVDILSYFNTLLFPGIAALRLVRRLLPAPKDLQSDFTVGGSGANDLLSRVFSLEALGLPRMRYPFGVSLLAVARKSAGSASA